MKKVNCVVVILTFNCADSVCETVYQAKKLSDSIYVVDSFSADQTVSVLTALGCEVVQRSFENYGDQRNWAISQANSKGEWQLHLDADEVLDDEAVTEIRSHVSGQAREAAYLIRRKDYFMGKQLRFSGLNPWHLRLFKSGIGQCESRLYDQHFICNVAVGKIRGFMHDKNALTLSEWFVRHNRWSDLEAQQVVQSISTGGILDARITGDARERARYAKRKYYRFPIVARAILYFVYRYVFRLGFLDGTVGFFFAVFQALWFRLSVDAKIYELREERRGNPKN